MRKRNTPHHLSKRINDRPIMGSENFPWAMQAALVTKHCKLMGTFPDAVDILLACEQRSVFNLLIALSNTNLFLLKHMEKLCPGEVASLLQIVCLLKKYPFPKQELAVDKREVAKATFLGCEEMCDRVNSRLKVDPLPGWVPLARQLIAGVLGDLSPGLTMKIVSHGAHGPGSTLSSNRNRVTPYYKYADFPYTVSKSASMYACAAISSNPRWMDILEDSGRRRFLPLPSAPQYQKELQIFWDCTDIANCDKVTFVPKDVKTDRPIAVGASLNVFLQLGVKAYMEKRLKSVGVDLTDQGKNQEFARLGSLHSSMPDGSINMDQFSTIDLKSASDSVSAGLVELLLPPLWYAFLDDLRHKEYILDGVVSKYHKFSGMGNGFTFPLESLIFWAICKACTEYSGFMCTRNDIAVYGDDIIVRYKTSSAVIEALEWAGFSVNKDKTFLTGPFKESCGKDYFRGTDIRPFYLKRRVTIYEDIYFVCNSVNRIGISSPISCIYRDIYERCIAYIRKPDRNYSPMDDNSDSGVRCPLSFARRAGRFPVLSASDRSSAIRSRILDPEYAFLQCFYSLRTLKRPHKYRGREKIRLLVALEGERVPNPWNPLELEDVGVNSITRRDSWSRALSLAPVSNWDGSEFTPQHYSYFSQLMT